MITHLQNPIYLCIELILEDKIMKRPASLVIGILLLFLAFAQLLRFIIAVPIVVANCVSIPAWPSAVAAIFLALLGVWLLNERKQ
jgi:hypothetical protein